MNWPCETHRYFLVCSQGNAGSIWTARAFNLHDGLVCSMGNDHPIISMNETHPFNSLPDAAIETLTAAWTDRIVDAEDIALGVTQEESRARQLLREILERKGMLMDIPRRIPPLTPGETFAELERFHAGHIFGNVHGLTLTNLQRAAGRRGSYRFPVANLIRHPISRLQALIGRTIDIMPARTDLGPEREAAMNAHAALRAALTRYDVNWRDSRNRFRFWAVMGLRALEGWTTEIRDHPEIRHIPIERLMRDPSYFAETLTFLTAGGVTPDTAYLDTVFAPGRRHIGRMHPHATARPNPSEWEIFDAWPTWLQHIVREELNRLDAAPLYARFGYDLSFL